MEKQEKLYRPRDIYIQFGYPWTKLMELARKVNRKSNPEAEKGFHYLLKLSEVREYFGY